MLSRTHQFGMSDYRRFDRVGRPEGNLVSLGSKSGVLDDTRPGGLASEAYYGLREKPFALGSDPRFFYHSQPHAAAYEDLFQSIRRHESLSVVSGEIGTGKTTLCRAVLRNLDRQTFSAFVPDPFASREDLLKMVLMDFGVISIDDLTGSRLNAATRTELSYLLYEFLRGLAPLQAFAVVVIDEAQNLSPSLLEEIRILSDCDGRERQLQVVLIGQPELQEKLMLPELRQVEQRIAVRCKLEPLTREGVGGYVAHRLKVANGTPDRVSFSADALDALYEVSRGVPRLINRICDRALHHGHLKRVAEIDGPTLRQAMNDIGLKTKPVTTVVTKVEESAGVEESAKVEESTKVEESGKVKEPVPQSTSTSTEASIDDSPEMVDAWLDSIPRHTSTRRNPNPDAIPALPLPLDVLGFDLDDAVPRTYMERLGRRWAVRLGTLALWMGAVAAVIAFIMYGWDVARRERLKELREVVALAPPPAPVIALKPAPALPVPPVTSQPASQPLVQLDGSYMIYVTHSTMETRAESLVERLQAAGVRANRIAVVAGRVTWHQVIAGPYVTRSSAEVALQNLHQSREFQDARIVFTPPQ